MGAPVSVAEVMQEVLADRAFYQRSGGGLTLSGGEPLAQLAFTLELLKTARAAGIHTCIETSGYAPQSAFQQILPYVDLILFDYKVTGADEHRRYTGVSNELILSNLDFLYHAGKAIILRCPIISGINDSGVHFNAIGELSSRYPGLLGIELLPYHDMGNNKRQSIGDALTLSGLKTTPPELAQVWLEQVRLTGCEKVKIG